MLRARRARSRPWPKQGQVLGHGEGSDHRVGLDDLVQPHSHPPGGPGLGDVEARVDDAAPDGRLQPPEMARSRVVLPAPLVPISATTAPSCTVRSTPNSTCTDPYDTDSCSTDSSGGPDATGSTRRGTVVALDTATTVSASRAGAANRRTDHPTTTSGRPSTASFHWSGQPPAIQVLNEAAASAPAPAPPHLAGGHHPPQLGSDAREHRRVQPGQGQGDGAAGHEPAGHHPDVGERHRPQQHQHAGDQQLSADRVGPATAGEPVEPVVPGTEGADQGGRPGPGGQHRRVLDRAALPLSQQQRLGCVGAADGDRSHRQGGAVGPAGPRHVDPGDGGLHFEVVVVGQGVAGDEHRAHQRQRGTGPQHGAVGDGGEHAGRQRPARAGSHRSPVPRQRAEPIGLSGIGGQKDAVEHQPGRRSRGQHDAAGGEHRDAGRAGHHGEPGRGQQSGQGQHDPGRQRAAHPWHDQRGHHRGRADQDGLAHHRAEHAETLGDLPTAEQQHRQRGGQCRALAGDGDQQPGIARPAPLLDRLRPAHSGMDRPLAFTRRSQRGRRSAPCTRSRRRT